MSSKEISKKTSQTYRDKMVEEGRKELRVWVLKQHHDYVKRKIKQLIKELEQ